MNEGKPAGTALFLKPSKPVVIILLILFLLGGLGVRLIDLTDLPLDFAATRQLHSLIMARGYYYQMESAEDLGVPANIRRFGINMGKAEPVIEPPIVEKLAAFTYRLIGEENILVPRLYSIFFWVIGGIPLFLLSKKLMPLNGAFAALALYLFNPFGAVASRAFQPDPLMVMLILWALYFQVNWAYQDNLKNAILAGLFTGIAFLVKAPSVFFVGFTMLGLVLHFGIKRAFKSWHIYLMAVLSLVPAITFNLISATVGGNAGAIFGARWFPNLFTDPKWYLSWLLLGRTVAGTFPLVLALLGAFFIREKLFRVFYFCMWLGYVLYGFTFAYHIYTHNYYHLPLIPIVAIGFGIIFAVLFEKLEEISKGWLPKVLVVLVLVFALALSVQRIRGELVGSEYRQEAAYWQEISNTIGTKSRVIALTHDYGYRLVYWGYLGAQIWPTTGDLTVKELIGSTDPELDELFKMRTEGMDYFLVTLMGDFKSQKGLSQYLYAHYPYTEGDGYLLFDLNDPLK